MSSGVLRSFEQNSRTGPYTISLKLVKTPPGPKLRLDQRVASTPFVMLPPETLVMMSNP